MFVLGHLGIGSKLVSPWSQGLPKRWLLLGTLLPDLIDKPLYYGLSWATGQKGAELGWISCTRTFAHTGIFLLLLALVAFFKRSRAFAALTLGVATHLLLDNVADVFQGGGAMESSALIALVFPAMGWRFAVIPFADAKEHLAHVVSRFTLVTESVGLGILLWDHWKDVHQSEILTTLQLKRRLRKLAKRKT